MIAYLDTSAVVPLLIDEPTSPVCTDLWESADLLVSCRLVEIEAVTALHRARRLERLGGSTLSAALRSLDPLLTDVDMVEVDPALIDLARQCAAIMPLEGYDAVHCAAGLLTGTSGPGTVLVTGDQQRSTAWRRFGAEVLDLRPTA